MDCFLFLRDNCPPLLMSFALETVDSNILTLSPLPTVSKGRPYPVPVFLIYPELEFIQFSFKISSQTVLTSS